MKEFTIALVGKPDPLKNDVFNMLVGWNQQSTMWPTYSLIKQEGKYLHGEIIYHFINLPCASSLSSDSDEAKLILDFIRQENTHATIILSEEDQLMHDITFISDVLKNTTQSILCINTKKKHFRKKKECGESPLNQWFEIPIIRLHKREKKGFLQLIDCLDQLLN